MNVGNEEWQHHFRNNNMQLLKQHSEMMQEKEVLKLAFQCSLNKWDESETILTEKFHLLLETLQLN
jgi:hypothetical protein